MNPFAGLFRKLKLESQLDSELRFHIEQKTAELIAQGVKPTEARRRAMAKFGGVEAVKEDCRDALGTRFFGTVVQDVRFGLRILSKSPGFTAVAILTLALGIGANIAIFSLIDAVLLHPFPVRDSSQLVDVFAQTKRKTSPSQDDLLSYVEYQNLLRQSSSFSGLLAYQTTSFAIEGENGSQLVPGALVTGNYFDTLGIQAALGRTFDAAEVAGPGGSRVAVIGYDLWQTHFGGNRDVLGKTINLGGRLFTVVGVAPASFNGMAITFGPEIWVPLTDETTKALGVGPGVASSYVQVVGRLKPGMTTAQARAEMSAIADRLARQYPKADKNQTIVLLPANSLRMPGDPEINRALGSLSLLLMAVVGLILLIACANVSAMSLARAASRRKEIAVRIAVGAGRWRLVRQLLTESLLLSLAGGAGAIGVTVVLDRIILSIPSSMPQIASALNFTLCLHVDYRVLLFTLIVALLTTALFGMAPALEASGARPSDALKEEGRGSGSARHRLLNALVVVQVAISVVLLACAGLCLRSAYNAYRVPLGFDPHGLVTARFLPDMVGYKPAQETAFYDKLLRRVKALPGAIDAALAGMLPLTVSGFFSAGAIPSSKASSVPRSQWTKVGYSDFSPGYFSAMRIPILRGRPFTGEDTASAPLVAIVNQVLAARFWPGEDPIGKLLRIGEKDYEVVGVAATGKYNTLGENPSPFVYRCLPQTGGWVGWLVVRSSVPPASMLASIRQIARQIGPNVPAAELNTYSEAMAPSLFLPKLAAEFFGLAGLLGLGLACAGIYGVISYSVNQRIHEIGIRVALGAQQGDIARLVLRRGVGLTLLGVGIGLAGAFAVTRVLSAILYGISATDPVTFVGVPLLLILVALAACFIPARRASRIDPIAALRQE